MVVSQVKDTVKGERVESETIYETIIGLTFSALDLFLSYDYWYRFRISYLEIRSICSLITSPDCQLLNGEDEFSRREIHRHRFGLGR